MRRDLTTSATGRRKAGTLASGRIGGVSLGGVARLLVAMALGALLGWLALGIPRREQSLP